MIRKIEKQLKSGKPVSFAAALAVLSAPVDSMPDLMALTNRLRRKQFGRKARLCSIMNAKSGACSGDCHFCAQSSRHSAGVQVYPLRSSKQMADAYEAAGRSLPVDHFGIVTSGERLSPKDVAGIRDTIKNTRTKKLRWCASLGSLDRKELSELKEAGLTRFHHNLETAESFFPKICTTHTWRERLAMVRRAKSAGLETCSGGILGLGETLQQRVELAMTLRDEAVDSIPLNFLVPLPGTELEHIEPMKPMDILRAIAMFRLVNTKAEIKVCAGRAHMRDLQSMIFFAGATGMMIGPLLTIAGGDVQDDLTMLQDLEIPFKIER